MKFKIFRYGRVKSTNQTAIRIIKNSNSKFGLVISDLQTNGKGQYGRKWISIKGNIFLSFFYKLEKINLPLNIITKKNCFLVKKVIAKYYKKKIIFKSPNDLLINKKKICGILQEKIEKSDNNFLVVGIGINLIKKPKILNYATTSLYEITKQKINKKLFENQLKITFEKFLSKYYKFN